MSSELKILCAMTACSDALAALLLLLLLSRLALVRDAAVVLLLRLQTSLSQPTGADANDG